MEPEKQIAHFSYDNPISLLRSVRVLLAAQGIAIKSLGIHPQTVRQMMDSVSSWTSMNISPFNTPSGRDGEVCGIPFIQSIEIK